jgi:hypothetical protein
MQPTNRRIVRSNGRFYRLSRREYLVYKIFNISIWFFLIIFGTASIVIKTDHIGSVAVPHQLWFSLAICVAALGYIGIKAITSRGILVDDIAEHDAAMANEEPKRVAARNTKNISMIISGGFLTIFASLGIAAGLNLHKPITPGEVVILLMGAIGCGYGIIGHRKARAAWRDDQQRTNRMAPRRFAISWAHMVPLAVAAFLFCSALYHLWVASAQRGCSLSQATTWTACADTR